MSEIDLNKLEYVEDEGFQGEIVVDFLGTTVKPILIIQTEDDKIDNKQYESYNKLIENWDKIQHDVIKKVLDYYNDEEKGSYGPDDKEEFDRWWPEINTISEMEKQIELDGIIIPYASMMDDVYSGRCVYLTFSKKYGEDIDDNGIGVQIINEEIKKIGYKDIAF